MNSYHFIGIKGSGMSALAQILHDLGHTVQGEDVASYIFTQEGLEKRHIAMYLFGEASIVPDMQIIASNAFDDEHPVMLRFRKADYLIVRYHDFLGHWIKDYTSVAITGTHGKTTTTGMMSQTFRAIEPVSSLIGDGTGCGDENARLFIFESCEYKRHFLAYQPEIAVITNIDFDHPDYYANLQEVQTAFEEMTGTVGKQLVVCGDDGNIRSLRTDKKILYYGLNPRNELRADAIKVESEGTSFDVFWLNHKIERYTIPMYGKHNVLNALAVIGVAIALNYDLIQIQKQMKLFKGVKRRFAEKLWKDNVIIDDYAHHPAEIKATLEAAKSKYPDKKIVAIFQPHTFSRVEKFMTGFALSLQGADAIYLCPIFGSSREEKGDISIEQLQDLTPNSKLLTEHTISDLTVYHDSIFVFMGAGDIQKYQTLLSTLC